MVHIHMDPVLFHLGPLVVSWHGLWLAAGIATGCLVFLLEGSKQGFDRNLQYELILWIVVCGYVGARLLHVLLYDWQTYATHPLRILAIHEGGLTILGGVIGGTIAAVAFARREGLSFWRLADPIALGLPVGMIIGRVGCTIAGDVWGVPTGGSWGLVYWHPNASIPAYMRGVATFPAPIVLQIWNAGLLVLLLAIRGRLRQPGTLFLTYIIGYSLGRFITNIWQAEDPLLFGLKPTQLTAIAMASLGILFLLYLRGARATSPGHSRTSGSL